MNGEPRRRFPSGMPVNRAAAKRLQAMGVGPLTPGRPALCELAAAVVAEALGEDSEAAVVAAGLLQRDPEGMFKRLQRLELTPQELERLPMEDLAEQVADVLKPDPSRD